MPGFVDLHCHCVPGIDDGVRSQSEAFELLRALRDSGFTKVVATPHMRPGLFDNTTADITIAFEALLPSVQREPALPTLSISCEHYFDETVFSRLLQGTALPYPGGRAVLVELYDMDFSSHLAQRLFDLRRRRLLPVIAHPERYRALWRDPDRLEAVVDAGAAALLDLGALVGKYGREPQRCAEELLERGLYRAACSDAHRPSDVLDVAKGIAVIDKRYGAEEVDQLLRHGPEEILQGITEQ